MYAKEFIDGIRQVHPSFLTLARSRDHISRLVFGVPYSAALAAENAGKLQEPGLFPEIAGKAISCEHEGAAEVIRTAQRHVLVRREFRHLRPRDIDEIRSISAERDSKELPEAEFVGLENPKSFAYFAPRMEIQRRLKERIGLLDEPAINELKALAWLGRGDGNELLEMVKYAEAHADAQDAAYLASMGPLHHYLDQGLRRLGRGLELGLR